MGYKGFSLAEVLVSVSLLAIVTLCSFKLYERIAKTNNRRELEEKVDTALALSARFIQRTGRTAQSCSKVLSGSNPTLECQVDVSKPASGNLKKVRFATDASSLRFEEWDEVSLTWNMKTLFKDVQFLTFCDGTEMAAGTCAIPPLAIHSIAGFSGHKDRIFRIYLHTKLTPQAGVEIERGLTAAFYVRNPSPYGDNIVFQ